MNNPPKAILILGNLITKKADNCQLCPCFKSSPRDGERGGSDSRREACVLPHVHWSLGEEKQLKGTTPNKPTHTRLIHLSQSGPPHPLPFSPPSSLIVFNKVSRLAIL